MDNLDKQVAETMGEDYALKSFRKGKEKALELKGENKALKERVELLLKNNTIMMELIETFEVRMRELKSQLDFAENFVYSFEKGGWAEREALNKKKAEVSDSKKLSVSSINKQLEEILRLLAYNKKKLKA